MVVCPTSEHATLTYLYRLRRLFREEWSSSMTQRRLLLISFMQEGVCMKSVLVFCVVMATMGCSSRWTQEGKSYTETKQDAADCADSILAEHRNLNSETVKTCMEAKGYRLHTAQPVQAESVHLPAEAPTPKTEVAP